MSKKKSFTGDLFAPDGGFVVDAGEERKVPAEQSEAYADKTHHADMEISEEMAPPEPKMSETKSKRLNLLVRPGMLKEFAKIAYMQQTSVNDLINRLIAEHNEKEAGTIRQYNRLFNKKA
jgi:predicted HicB family RNase H-like nuclease